MEIAVRPGVVLTSDVSGILPTANGGTGVATLAANGVLYGNETGVVLVTAQGAANSVLIANAGAPSFSASPTIGTSVTTPTLIGGTGTTSTLTLKTTTGIGAAGADIIFVGGNNGATEFARFLNSGAFGLGRSPSVLLDLANGHIRLDQAFQIQWFSGATQRGSILCDSGSNLTFQTGSSNTEQARFDSSGNLNIATTGQTGAKVYIAQSGNGETLHLDSNTGTRTGGSVLKIFDQQATGDADAFSASVAVQGKNNSNQTAPLLYLYSYAAASAQIGLKIDKNGGTGLAAEIGGLVGIGLTSVDANYFLELPNDSTKKAKAQAWDTYSDERMKTGVVPITDGLAKVLALRPVSFFQHDTSQAEDDGIFAYHAYGVQTVGLIAQEAIIVAPEIVSPGHANTELWAIDYSKCIPLLIHAIQALQAQITALKPI